jgi:hypothetical protein
MTAKSLTHAFVSAIADGTDATLVRSSSWNADHNLWLGFRSVLTTTDTLANGDHLCLITYSNPAAIAVALPAPSAPNFPLGWFVRLLNEGAGTVTVTAASQINGGTTLTLATGESVDIHGTGTPNYRAAKILASGVYAPLASPAFTGTPTAPTPTGGDNSTKIATTAFVAAAAGGGAIALGGRLTYVSTTALKFSPYQGNYIRLNGAFRQIPAAGIVGLGSTGVFVNGVAGQSLAANTTYWVFCFDNGGVLTADFRTGATHATSVTAGNEGVEILTGNDTRSLIGQCRSGAAAGVFLAPSANNISVLSWFNQRRIAGMGFFSADRSTAANVPTEINTEIRVNFLSWVDPVQIAVSGSVNNGSVAYSYSFLAIDATIIDGGTTVVAPSASWSYGIGASVSWTPTSEGWHTATIYGMAQSTTTATWGGSVAPATLSASQMTRCTVSAQLNG